MQIKPVTRQLAEFSQIAALYESAFPENERVPLRLLLLFSRRKCADFLAFYSEGQFAGFTYLITVKETTFVFYLATDAAQRSKGHGSRMLGEIAKKYEKNTLTLNIESVTPAAENYAQRVRRQQFYLKNGFLDSGYLMQDTESTYDVLYKGARFSQADFKKIFTTFSFGLVRVKLVKKTAPSANYDFAEITK